jgi:hypothetical protein
MNCLRAFEIRNVRRPLSSAACASTLRLAAIACACACACAAIATRTLSAQVPRPQVAGSAADTLDPNFVPAGFGSLRQDDIAIKVAPSSGLQVRAIPLDERILRLLSPDSYRSLRDLARSKDREINAVKDRTRLPSYSLWYVSFYALEQGETRFSPQEFVINNVGRDFRPIDVVPLSPGFGEYRLKQREVQSALFLFDGQLDLNQPLTGNMEGTASATDWTQVLEKVDRERALVRSRAAAKQKPPA